MMKCKYCGGNLTLEQAYCPHWGRPNEEAAEHVKDMEHYKSNFEDTKSDVYEVAEKNTEIMSHMIIITVLVILCVVVFVVSARSWSIHRGLLQFDAGIRQGSYMKQMEQYLEDEDYIGLSAFCDRHYIRPYSSNNSYEKYQLLMEASGAYRYFYESLMKAVTINSGNVSILPGLYEDISDYYEQLERILHPVDNDYRAKQYRELPEEQKEAILRMEENVKALLQTYFDMTPEEAENFGTMSNAQKILFLEEKGEVMGYGKSEE